tara:strand:- start:26550 stop:28892 length:2343 start_codon:yes stop_codon:yes gene_type:complete
MAAPTIPNGEEHCFVITYEGNGGGQRVGRFVPFTDNGTIANSLIFNRSDNPELSRTPSSGGNRRTFTISAWIKLGSQFGQRRIFFSQGPAGSGNNYFLIEVDTSNKLYISANDGSGGEDLSLITNRTFEDTSKFYHILFAVDTTQSTASNRAKLYVDGDQITSFSTETYFGQNYDTNVNHTVKCVVGDYIATGYGFDGYIAEFNLVDGTALTPDTFGLTDTSTGRWIPKALTGITYGTNGFRLQFGSSSALGDDTSGNTNDFSVTNLVASDQTTDSPTQNHATLNPNPDTSGTLSEGNLKLLTNNTGYNVKLATLKPTSGKYYMEITVNAAGSTPTAIVGVQEVATAPSSSSQYFPRNYGYGWYQNNGNIYDAGTNVVTSGSSYTSGDVLAIALDLDNQEVKFYKNNSLDNTIGLNGTHVAIAVADYANSYYAQLTCNFGQKSFTYTPPTGFVALQQDNLPETAKGVSGLVWNKNRDSTYNHGLWDSSRGKFLFVSSNTNAAETTALNGTTKFLKGGFTVGAGGGGNNSGDSIVAWNWVANGGNTSSNSNGSISSTVQANTTAGFSIVQYTGNRSSGATIGHGLNQAPEVIITKNLDATYNWIIYFKQQGANKYGYLNLTNTWVTDTTGFNNVEPTSTVFTVGSAYESNGTQDMVAYCFHSVAGYSKMGNYIGNGVADGPFIYTGFKPRFIIHKGIDIASNGRLIDTARNPFNPVTQELYTDTTGVEYDMGARGTDFLSNGFKIRQESGYGMNNSGINYFYMAFAEHPFVGDGTSPVTAR